MIQIKDPRLFVLMLELLQILFHIIVSSKNQFNERSILLSQYKDSHTNATCCAITIAR